MMAAGKVSGYDIELLILAQNQGMARYKTVASEAKANIYASELKLEKLIPTCQDCPSNYRFNFTLNENAKDVSVNIIKDGTVVKVLPVGALAKGTHSVSGNFEGVSPGEYTWSVTVVGDGVDRPLKISDNANALMQFNYPRSVSVDNNFNSEYFGRIYVSESAQGTLPARTTQMVFT